MLKSLPYVFLFLVVPSAFAGISVSGPGNGATVQSPVHYVASASTSCSKGISAMGIYTADDSLAYVVKGSKLDTTLSLNPGKYKTVVQEWDHCGGSDKVTINITVSNSSTVQVSSPSNNSTVSGPVHYAATATTGCSKGISAMGIYTGDNALAYTANGASLDTHLNLNPGTYNTTVQSWDHCGGGAKTPVTVKVSSSGPGVTVASPANNSTVTSPVHFQASATSSCSKGVSAVGLYPAAGQLAVVKQGSSLDTNLNLNPGKYTVVAQEWDKCGGSAKTPVALTVSGGSPDSSGGLPSNAKTFSDLQAAGGWTGYALLPPNYPICDHCVSGGPETTWSWNPGNNPQLVLSGKATKTTIGGNTVYSDVLWNNHLIGDFSSRGLPDTSKTLIPTLHHFVYDVWFYGDNLEVSQALEFDLNQFFGGKSFIWGHECRIQGGHEWDIWDNVTEHWIKTGIPCKPVSGKWNHLVLRVQRTSDDKQLFESIELNGQVNPVNHTGDPRSTNWYGVTANYQIDGNNVQKPYAVFIDRLNFSYW